MGYSVWLFRRTIAVMVGILVKRRTGTEGKRKGMGSGDRGFCVLRTRTETRIHGNAWSQQDSPEPVWRIQFWQPEEPGIRHPHYKLSLCCFKQYNWHQETIAAANGSWQDIHKSSGWERCINIRFYSFDDCTVLKGKTFICRSYTQKSALSFYLMVQMVPGENT